MSRVIKFRVWRDKFSFPNGESYSGTWLPERYLGLDGHVYLDDYGICSEHYVEEYGSKLYVEQFTGLFDQNGKEIYEGDVISAHEYEDEKCEPNIGIIRWGEYNDDEYVSRLETWMIQWVFDVWDEDKRVGRAVKPDAWPTPLSCAVYSGGVRYSRGKQVFSSSLKVIGNVHENPELLK